MKAVAQSAYGGPEKLAVADVPRPDVAPDRVLVRVRAASVNPVDWHFLRGDPFVVRIVAGLRRPKTPVRGVDVSGTVEGVGAEVAGLAPGDEVFGTARGSFAEYAVADEDLATKPAGLTFEQAATLGVAGATAWEAVCKHGPVEAGQRVLVNGASGGVGTFAVQIAKARGAHVTGVCSTGNLALVRGLGADEVVDYTSEDFTRTGPYDVVLDNVGNRKLAEVRSALAPEGTLVVVAGGKGVPLIGGLSRTVHARALGPFVGQRLATFIAEPTKAVLVALKELVEDGKLTPVIDRTYPLEQTADAMRYAEAGHARGKVVVTVRPSIAGAI